MILFLIHDQVALTECIFDGLASLKVEQGAVSGRESNDSMYIYNFALEKAVCQRQSDDGRGTANKLGVGKWPPPQLL